MSPAAGESPRSRTSPAGGTGGPPPPGPPRVSFRSSLRLLLRAQDKRDHFPFGSSSSPSAASSASMPTPHASARSRSVDVAIPAVRPVVSAAARTFCWMNRSWSFENGLGGAGKPSAVRAPPPPADACPLDPKSRMKSRNPGSSSKEDPRET